MWKFFLLALLSLTAQSFAQTSQKIVPISAKISVNFSMCDSPNQSTAEPEKCCNFPELFSNSVMDQCEKEFSSNDSMKKDEALADSVRFQFA